MDEPAFSEPWHAQAFAMTIHLSKQGVFSWPEWAEKFGATLAAHGLSRELDGGEDYYNAWIETLETVLIDAQLTETAAITQMIEDWREAYLSTPHGQPVKLSA
ncbi:MAG: nitrile hydratase accessory protein [Paracoccaceae bacterium]|nr:nitrile hydratase accessory protein [Paracoccaceae bacterium]MDG1739325.1 nitrile hydratase accessory protein [Paracoccaceae bacterium]MDG2259417.1 nitrile hydratase accessory protein [Paracoccaceae bacterium]